MFSHGHNHLLDNPDAPDTRTRQTGMCGLTLLVLSWRKFIRWAHRTQSFLSLIQPLHIFESVFHVSSFSLPPLLLSLLYFESSSPDLLRSRLAVPPASCLFPLKSTSHKSDEAIYLQPKFYHFLKPLYHPGAAAKSLLGSYHLCQLASLCN